MSDLEIEKSVNEISKLDMNDLWSFYTKEKFDSEVKWNIIKRYYTVTFTNLSNENIKITINAKGLIFESKSGFKGILQEYFIYKREKNFNLLICND